MNEGELIHIWSLIIQWLEYRWDMIYFSLVSKTFFKIIQPTIYKKFNFIMKRHFTVLKPLSIIFKPHLFRSVSNLDCEECGGLKNLDMDVLIPKHVRELFLSELTRECCRHLQKKPKLSLEFTSLQHLTRLEIDWLDGDFTDSPVDLSKTKINHISIKCNHFAGWKLPSVMKSLFIRTLTMDLSLDYMEMVDILTLDISTQKNRILLPKTVKSLDMEADCILPFELPRGLENVRMVDYTTPWVTRVQDSKWMFPSSIKNMKIIMRYFNQPLELFDGLDKLEFCCFRMNYPLHFPSSLKFLELEFDQLAAPLSLPDNLKTFIFTTSSHDGSIYFPPSLENIQIIAPHYLSSPLTFPHNLHNLDIECPDIRYPIQFPHNIRNLKISSHNFNHQITFPDGLTDLYFKSSKFNHPLHFPPNINTFVLCLDSFNHPITLPPKIKIVDLEAPSLQYQVELSETLEYWCIDSKVQHERTG